MKRLLSTFMVLCLLAMATQAKTIKGKVIAAADGEALIGATIMPVGGNNGTATDVNGEFTLNVDNHVKFLNVSYIGLST